MLLALGAQGVVLDLAVPANEDVAHPTLDSELVHCTRVGVAATAWALRVEETTVLVVPLQLVMCHSAGGFGFLCCEVCCGSTRIRGAAWMLFPIVAPPVCYILAPMSNPEDGVNDIFLPNHVSQNTLHLQ
jgi:hypothetical protein